MISQDYEDALLFFDFSNSYTLDDLKKKYRELALKYHPDRGEFTSDTMFLQLIHYKNILEENLSTPSPLTPAQKKQSKDPSYRIYRTAKKMENDTILGYFQARKKMPLVVLSESNNPDLIELRKNLETAKLLYNQLIKEFPDSIWARDAKDSLASLDVWWKS